MENIFSHAWKGRHGVEQLEADKKISSGDLSTLEDYDQVNIFNLKKFVFYFRKKICNLNGKF